MTRRKKMGEEPPTVEIAVETGPNDASMEHWRGVSIALQERINLLEREGRKEVMDLRARARAHARHVLDLTPTHGGPKLDEARSLASKTLAEVPDGA